MHFSASRARPGLLDDPGEGEHLWVAVSTHVLSPANVETMGSTTYLDAENLASVAVGCYKCTKAYSEEMRAEPCEGMEQ